MTDKEPITMDDIARLARVSKPTVSRALSGSPLVRPETREHVLAVARQYGYAVNRNAQKLRHKRTNTICVSIDYGSFRKNHITDPFIFDLLAGVSEALGELDQDILLCSPKHNGFDFLQQVYLSRGADGFIFLGQGHRENLLQQFSSSTAPFIVWGAKKKNNRYCVVGSDNYRGGMLAGNYLLGKNRRQILFVGDISHPEIGFRRRGLEDSVARCPEPVTVDVLVLNSFSFESALASANHYLSRATGTPDGVFAYSDTAAMAFIYAFQKAGFAVPGDVSVVGYNDLSSAAFFHPAITTIRQDTYLAGELLVKKLMRLVDQKKTVSGFIPTELIVRET